MYKVHQSRESVMHHSLRRNREFSTVVYGRPM